MLAKARSVLQSGIDEGLHLGAQLSVSRRGEVVDDSAIGEARRGVPMQVDSLQLWMSSVKPLMGVAIAQLAERGLLGFDDRVAAHVPEFAAGGKEAVTLRHVLTHTGGFPAVAALWSARPWEEILAEICAAPLSPGWRIGVDAGYHVASGWYVLGEVVQRRDGRDVGRYVREAIFASLGVADAWLGMPATAHASYGDLIAPMHDTAGEAPRVHPFWGWDGSAKGCALVRPGGSAWGPIRALRLMYDALLAGGAGAHGRLLTQESVAAIAAPSSVGALDRLFAVPLDRGLGVVLDSKRYGPGSAWFGDHCGTRTFGHGGHQCSVGFADPEHGLAVAIGCNGMPGDVRHAARMRAVVNAVYEDLGLAGS